MSIVTCIETNLPSALKEALESKIGSEKASEFKTSLEASIKSQKWTLHVGEDIKQIEGDLKKAVQAAGIDWSLVGAIVLETAKDVASKCK